MAQTLDTLALDINLNVSGLAEVQQVQTRMRSLDTQIQRGTRTVRAHGQSYTNTSRDMRRWAQGALQQAGYQVGDFFVQIANGTSRMQAFGQQGSQLLGIFGPIGAVAGAGVAIFSAFAVAMERSAGAARSFDQALGEVEAMLGDVRDATDVLNTSTSELRQQYGQAATRVRELAVAELELAVARQRAALSQGMQNEELQAATRRYGDLTRIVDSLGNVYYDTTDAARTLMRDFTQLSGGQAATLARAFFDLRNAANIDDQVAAWQNIQQLLDSSGISLTDLNGPLAAALSGVVALEGATIDLETAFANAAAAGANLPSVMPIFPTAPGGRGTYGMPGVGRTPSWRVRQPSSPGTTTGGGGGGGARATQTYQDLIEQMNREAEARRELLGLSEEMQAIREIELQLLGRVQGEVDAVTAAEIRGAAERIAALNAQNEELERIRTQQEQLAETIGQSFGTAITSIVSGTQSAGDAFRQMAQRIISELFEVLVVQRMVASLTQAIGGGGGGGFLGALLGVTGRAIGGPITGGKPYMVGERGPELVVPSRNGTVIPNNQLGGGQPVQVVYNFQGGVTEADLGRALPLLVERTKREVVEAVQRGGSVARVFS